MRASLRLTLYGFCTMLQASYAAGKLRGSVRRASGLVLTGKPYMCLGGWKRLPAINAAVFNQSEAATKA